MHPIRDRRVVLDMTRFDRGDAPFLFDPERRLLCEISRERDIASTLSDPARRASHHSRARLFCPAAAIGVRAAVAHILLEA
jgi:hypothetical protein